MKISGLEVALDALQRNAIACGNGWALGRAGQRWPLRVAWPVLR